MVYNSEEAFQHFNNRIQRYRRVPAAHWPGETIECRLHTGLERPSNGAMQPGSSFRKDLPDQEIFKPRPEDRVTVKD